MNIILSLDYEVFFGRHTGTVERTLLDPSEALCEMAKKYGLPLVFFVDIGFLLRLKLDAARYISLMHDYDRIMRQLDRFVELGHEIQLHVHPHWEDSYWDGEAWNIDTRRFRLHDFDEMEIKDILRRYSKGLREVAGEDAVFAYRAGGWMIQPFTKIRDALLTAGICIDSTVFSEGISEGDTHVFDFTAAPDVSRWFFDNDPLTSAPDGDFLEIPIASYPVSPFFYWKMALAKTLGGDQHKSCGDGIAIELSRSDLIGKLSSWTSSVVSIDGYKASFLVEAAQRHEQSGKADFVVMGHPKAVTPYSLQRLKEFIESRQMDEFVGYSMYRKEFSYRNRIKNVNNAKSMGHQAQG